MSRPMNEVCFLVDRGARVLWSDASSSPVALPDSRARWEAIHDKHPKIARGASPERAIEQLAALGGGNNFIEL